MFSYSGACRGFGICLDLTFKIHCCPSADHVALDLNFYFRFGPGGECNRGDDYCEHVLQQTIYDAMETSITEAIANVNAAVNADANADAKSTPSITPIVITENDNSYASTN